MQADLQQKQMDAGEVLVTLLPVNEKLPWITPARFRPELVPEELMAPALTVSLHLETLCIVGGSMGVK